MIRILNSQTDDVFAALRARAVHRDLATEKIVGEIIHDVRTRGDSALLDSARRFDAPELESIHVSEEEIATAKVEPDVEAALQEAFGRVSRFHAAQRDALFGPEMGWQKDPTLPNEYVKVDRSQPGLGQRYVPLHRAGVYVPGGNATYPSSVLMNAGPAKVSGVKETYVTTPAQHDGSLHPAVLTALRIVGVDRAFKIGGAAAIAALALGTESISRVDKVVGPGNRFVNEAKRQLWGQVGVDGYAGPSEVCVLADDSAHAGYAAADLLTQVEHAPDNAGFLVCVSDEKLREVLSEVEKQLQSAPREASMREALKNYGLAIVAKDLSEAVEIVNAIAPEHLSLAVNKPEALLDQIQNAGCILMGEFTPESAGDYCLGPSHTLPTSGAARWQSPVNVLDFVKVQSVVRMSSAALQPLIPTIETLANVEGFPAHGFGATIRRP